jgi:ABC-type multidrug transport system, permease component
MTAITNPARASRRPADRTIRASVPIRDILVQTTTFAWRALLKMRRNPEQLADVTFMPLVLTLLFGFMFGGAVAGGMVGYLPTLIPGIIAYSAVTACVAAGAQLREDMDKGVFDRFRSLPIARIAPLAGPMMADLTRYALAASLSLTMGIIMGYRPGGGVPGVIGGVLLAMVTGWSLAWIFMYIGTIAKSAQSVQSLSIMVLLPLTFVSNAFVPVDSLPDWLKTLVGLNPVSHVVTALRDLLNDGAVTPAVGYALLGCVVVVAIFVPLTVRSYSKKV